MTEKTHDAFATASLVAAAALYPPESLNLFTLFAAIIGNNIGAIIPDLDQAGNRLWDLLPAGDTMGKIFRRVFYKHRTLSHSLLGYFLVFSLLSWLLPKVLNSTNIDSFLVLQSIMIGYASHIFADMLTREGVPLLFPFKLSFGLPPFEKLRITTGSWIERAIIFPGVWVLTFYIIYRFQDTLKLVINLI